MDKVTYEKIKDELPAQLIKDIEEYGLENFEFEIVDTASSEEELDNKHKEYIKKFNSLEPNGYNVRND